MNRVLTPHEEWKLERERVARPRLSIAERLLAWVPRIAREPEPQPEPEDPDAYRWWSPAELIERNRNTESGR